MRMNPFHGGRANERQPALYGDLDYIAPMPLREEFIDQAMAHDVQLFGDDRLDRRVIRQCAAVDRGCFKGMSDQRFDVGLKSNGELLCQR